MRALSPQSLSLISVFLFFCSEGTELGVSSVGGRADFSWNFMGSDVLGCVEGLFISEGLPQGSESVNCLWVSYWTSILGCILRVNNKISGVLLNLIFLFSRLREGKPFIPIGEELRLMTGKP